MKLLPTVQPCRQVSFPERPPRLRPKICCFLMLFLSPSVLLWKATSLHRLYPAAKRSPLSRSVHSPQSWTTRQPFNSLSSRVSVLTVPTTPLLESLHWHLFHPWELVRLPWSVCSKSTSTVSWRLLQLRSRPVVLRTSQSRTLSVNFLVQKSTRWSMVRFPFFCSHYTSNKLTARRRC